MAAPAAVAAFKASEWITKAKMPPEQVTFQPPNRFVLKTQDATWGTMISEQLRKDSRVLFCGFTHIDNVGVQLDLALKESQSPALMKQVFQHAFSVIGDQIEALTAAIRGAIDNHTAHIDMSW